MTEIISRLKQSLCSEKDLTPTLDQRLDKLASDMQAPVKPKTPVFH